MGHFQYFIISIISICANLKFASRLGKYRFLDDVKLLFSNHTDTLYVYHKIAPHKKQYILYCDRRRCNKFNILQLRFVLYNFIRLELVVEM